MLNPEYSEDDIEKSPEKKNYRNTDWEKEYRSEKDEFLEMSHGSANNRLKRKIMFKLIMETGANICYRCGLPMTEEDFSIEHKKEWLWVDKKLFWDLDNISFSHLKCNSAHARKPTKVISPDGMGWCCKCKLHLSLDLFPESYHSPKEGKRKRKMCTQCNNARVSKHRENKTKNNLMGS